MLRNFASFGRSVNAWTSVHTEYRYSLLQAAEDPEVGAIVVTGEGEVSASAPMQRLAVTWRRADTTPVRGSAC